MKRGSIRAENNINFIRQLQNIYPKEIESFDSENISATESEVIDQGRYTWAPDGSNKRENFPFISSLHINTNRTSNRPSKMISGDIWFVNVSIWYSQIPLTKPSTSAHLKPVALKLDFMIFLAVLSEVNSMLFFFFYTSFIGY